MLGLRHKISLGFAGLSVIIAIIGIQSIVNLSRLGGAIDVILRENYLSVIACEQMKDALERIDSGLLFDLIGETGQAREIIGKNEARFEKALQDELSNITLPGEGEKAARIRDLYRQYNARIQEVEDTRRTAAVRREAYFSLVLPVFNDIRGTTDAILQMNQENMSEANDRARERAAAARSQMYVLLLAGTAAAAGFVVFSRRWVLRPVHRLIGYTDEIRRGNLDLVVPVTSRDEIGQLSEAFNVMAAGLREFRRTDQARLIRVQRATQQAFDSLPDVVAVLDTDGKVEVATESARSVFGLKPGVSVFDLPFDWLGGLFRKALADGRSAAPEGRKSIQQFVGSEERYYRPEAAPILDNDRSTTGVILVLKDVTQIQQQDEIKSGVIRTVSHQLNTPLTSVRMAIHLLLEEKIGALNEKQAELLVTAREDSDRLHEILNGLLDISRLESGKVPMDFRPVSPQALVADAAEPFRRAAQDLGVALDVAIAPGLPDVWVDTSRIGHVFSNLFSNAFKHTPPGGRITLSAEAAGVSVRFLVSDTGPGIPAPFLPRIFEPFFRVPGGGNETGAGLGLAIVKEIVEAHGGRVGVESEEGKGSTFCFTLRRADIPLKGGAAA